MKPYVVTIDKTHIIEVFAKDRNDAIAFVKRNNQARFHRGEYKKITGARAAWITSGVKQEIRDAQSL